MSWYIAPQFVLMAPRYEFRKLVTAIGIAFLFCIVCYAMLPAFIDRPEVLGSTLSERVLRFLYEHDPRWNIFPSFHASLCAILWRPSSTVAICAACVLTKQHNLLDLLAGIAVGSGAVLTVNIFLGRQTAEERSAFVARNREASWAGQTGSADRRSPAAAWTSRGCRS